MDVVKKVLLSLSVPDLRFTAAMHNHQNNNDRLGPYRFGKANSTDLEM